MLTSVNMPPSFRINMLVSVCVGVFAVIKTSKSLSLSKSAQLTPNFGIAGNPNADPLDPEILKIERKIELGADFIQTQAVYDVGLMKEFVKQVSRLKVPVIVGIAPFKSRGMMDWMVKNVPGIVVPEDIQKRLLAAREKSKEAFLDENLKIFGDLIKEIRNTPNVSGLHIMTIGFEWIVPKLIEKANQ